MISQAVKHWISAVTALGVLFRAAAVFALL